MTRKELMDLSKLVKAAYNDCRFLTVEEIEHLESTLQIEMHIQQARDFQRHLQKLERFVVDPHLDWQISIDGKSMILHNSTNMMSMFKDLVDEYIEYEL